MAKAPTPGGKRRDEQAERSLRVTDGQGKEEVLHWADLGPADSLECRKQTGFPFELVFEGESFGSDTLLILWWMARRKSAEPRLAFKQVLFEYPTYNDLAKFEVVELSPDEPEDEDHPSS